MHMLGNIFKKIYLHTNLYVFYIFLTTTPFYSFNKFQLIKTSGGYISVLLANQGS